MGPVAGIVSDAAQAVQHVFPAHLLEAPEQVAGVVQHDAGVAAFVDQLGDEATHAGVAVGKDPGVVVVAIVGMLEHVLEVADQAAVMASRDGGLVHMEGAGKAGLDLVQVEVGALWVDGVGVVGDFGDRCFSAANIRQAIAQRGKSIAGRSSNHGR